MLANFEEIKESKKFPLEKIDRARLFNKDYTVDSLDEFTKISEDIRHLPVPLFNLESGYYAPVKLGSKKQFDKSAFSNFKEYLKTIIETTNFNTEYNIFPEKLDLLDDNIAKKVGEKEKMLYGLVRWIENSKEIPEKTSNEDKIQEFFYKTSLAAKELEPTNMINLDLHKQNLIKSNDEVYIIDHFIVPAHYRNEGKHIGDRNLHTHYSPEVMYGGNISHKSTSYSLGSMFFHIANKKVWNKNKELIESCLEKKPENRPSLSKIEKELRQS